MAGKVRGRLKGRAEEESQPSIPAPEMLLLYRIYIYIGDIGARTLALAMRTIMLLHLAEVKVVESAGVGRGSILRQLPGRSLCARPSWSPILRNLKTHRSGAMCMPPLYPSFSF